MDLKNLRITALFLIVLCMTAHMVGCATTGGVLRAKELGRGISKVYPVNANEVWEIVKTVFRWEEIEVAEEHRREGYVLGIIEKSLISSGGIVGVWIEPVDENKTRLTVIVRTKSPTDFFAIFTEDAFYDDFELAARIKVGRSISPVAPAAPSSSVPQEGHATSKTIAPSESTDVVTVGWTSANIRSGPGDDFSLVATAKRGERLTVIGEDKDWLNVRLENGQEGWIARKKVR